MDRVNCVIIENNVLEFLDEIETQMTKKLICCKCPKPCEGETRCAMAMKNLLTDIHMFQDAYKKQNELEEVTEEKEDSV